MKIKCSYCGKRYATKLIAKGESDAKGVEHKGMGVFTCKDKDMRCKIIQNNLPKLV